MAVLLSSFCFSLSCSVTEMCRSYKSRDLPRLSIKEDMCVMTVATKKNEEVDGHARCVDVADSVHSVQDVADSVHEANENTLKSCG